MTINVGATRVSIFGGLAQKIGIHNTLFIYITSLLGPYQFLKVYFQHLQNSPQGHAVLNF